MRYRITPEDEPDEIIRNAMNNQLEDHKPLEKSIVPYNFADLLSKAKDLLIADYDAEVLYNDYMINFNIYLGHSAFYNYIMSGILYFHTLNPEVPIRNAIATTIWELCKHIPKYRRHTLKEYLYKSSITSITPELIPLLVSLIEASSIEQ